MAKSRLNELIQAATKAGVVGAGGGGFPTAAKLNTRQQVEVVIANGAECEPLLRADQELMRLHAREILSVLAVAVGALGAEAGVVALKKKYRPALAVLEAEIGAYPKLKLQPLPDIYPIGDEQVLTRQVTGRTVPPGGLPLAVGAVVLNVETLYNLFGAIQGLPVTQKWVTVAGAVENPVTVQVPLGTPVEELIQLAGGAAVEDWVAVAGGPCMGSLVSPDAPVTKTTKGIIILPANHPLAWVYRRSLRQDLVRALSVCCQCQQCTDLCPRHLLGHPLAPHRIMRAITYGQADATAVPQALLCSECGVCDLYACPFGLSPRALNRRIKGELQAAGFKPGWGDGGKTGISLLVEAREGREIPSRRLIGRLGIAGYDRPAPYQASQLGCRQVVLPLKQHAGVPARPVVQVGQVVEVGQLVAEVPEGSLGANLHASLNGQVTAVEGGIVITEAAGGVLGEPSRGLDGD